MRKDIHDSKCGCDSWVCDCHPSVVVFGPVSGAEGHVFGTHPSWVRPTLYNVTENHTPTHQACREF